MKRPRIKASSREDKSVRPFSSSPGEKKHFKGKDRRSDKPSKFKREEEKPYNERRKNSSDDIRTDKSFSRNLGGGKYFKGKDRRSDKPSNFKRKEEKPYNEGRKNSSDDIRPNKSFSSGSGEAKDFKKKRVESRTSSNNFKRERHSSSDSPKRRPKRFTRNKPYKEVVKDDDGLIRLNKYIANTGVCSRREADELIGAGAVSVNGEVITQMGYKVKPTDTVVYGGSRLKKEKLVYVLLNKPKDFITTTDDPMDRRTVMNLLKEACRERIYPVGRLDRSTTGVLLLTNDGELTKKLTHPSHNIKKVYHVELDKNLKHSDLQKILEGISLEDGVAYVDSINYVGEDKSQVGIELHSGKNRIVRRIFESLGYKVRKLDRVFFAGLTKKNLTRGRWRYLTEMEINMLKMLSAKS